jgi:hypothetical protein
MNFDVLNPNATVTIALQGLSVCCFNQSFDNNRGRWEVAIPRFEDHALTVEIVGLGKMLINRDVKVIEIKDRVGVATRPTHEVGDSFDRKDRQGHDKHDFRWITDFTNADELPHTNVRPLNNGAARVPVTMLYLQDALFYTKQIENAEMVRSSIKNTIPVDNGVLASGFSREEVGKVLDKTAPFGFEAKTVGIDIQSPRGGAVDIRLEQSVTATIPQGGGPQEIIIQNLDVPPSNPRAVLEEAERRIIQTQKFEFGLGDFFRYYELFQVDDDSKLHIWERSPITNPNNRTGDCNSVRVSLSNLDWLAQP